MNEICLWSIGWMTQMGKIKYLEQNLSKGCFVYHRFHMDCYWIEPWPVWWEASDGLPKPLHTTKMVVVVVMVTMMMMIIIIIIIIILIKDITVQLHPFLTSTLDGRWVVSFMPRLLYAPGERAPSSCWIADRVPEPIWFFGEEASCLCWETDYNFKVVQPVALSF